MFSNIEICTTWQCVNSFSSWFSAIISPAIALLSLYVSYTAYKYAKRKDQPKIDVSVNYCFISVPSKGGLAIALNIKNIGLRKVIINSYHFRYKLPRELSVSITIFHMKNVLNSLSPALPYELKEGDKVVFLNRYDVLTSSDFLSKYNKLKAWFIIQRMKIRIDCTTFEHEISLPKPQKKDLWKAYLAQKKL